LLYAQSAGLPAPDQGNAKMCRRLSRAVDSGHIAKALIGNNHDEHFLASTAHCAGRCSCKSSVAWAKSRPWK
ncbi:MAG TPA: hypothetical protein VIJ53_14625, partial [Acidobacteriaceae bacterium]